MAILGELTEAIRAMHELSGTLERDDLRDAMTIALLRKGAAYIERNGKII
jgi:hypothetical protein